MEQIKESLWKLVKVKVKFIDIAHLETTELTKVLQTKIQNHDKNNRTIYET